MISDNRKSTTTWRHEGPRIMQPILQIANTLYSNSAKSSIEYFQHEPARNPLTMLLTHTQCNGKKAQQVLTLFDE